MDEKSSKGDLPHFEHVLPAKTELDEAVNPDAPQRRKAIGINIVQNPLTVGHTSEPRIFHVRVGHEH